MDATDWVVRQLTLTFDSSVREYNQLTAAAVEAAEHTAAELYEHHTDYGSPRGMYEAILYGGTEPPTAVSQTRGWYRDAVGAVGEAVTDAIEAIMDDAMASVPEHIRGMITTLLDLGEWETIRQLGEHYMPESADDVFGEDN